jgi:hypothetical protein
MVVWLEIEICVIGRGGAKSGQKGGVGWVGEEVWGLLGFVALVCIWVYLHCCSRRRLSQGLQGAGGVYSWYHRLVSR